ncbi:MAG: ComF family protein, partial [Firmicutes bacterium]|nr:ComF family protein [Bacillota bacterium]
MCLACARHPRLFAVARAPAVYDGAMRDYIHRVKFGGERELGTALGRWLAGCAARERALRSVDRIVPV